MSMKKEIAFGDNFLVSDDSVDNSNETMNPSDYLVAFSGQNQSYCVGIVDMVDSTKIAATIGNEKIPRYYQIFLNSMAKILPRFGGFVIKNVGDCLTHYFPESSKSNKKYGFMSCPECSLAIIEYQDRICRRLAKEGLPPVDYRVSATLYTRLKGNKKDKMV